MQNRSERALPAVYEPSSVDWSLRPARAPIALEVFDVTYLHFHDTLELGACEEGRGVCYIEGQMQPFEAGDVQVIFPFQRHLSKSVGEASSRWYWLNLDPLRALAGWGGSDPSQLERWLNTEMGLCGILRAREQPELARLVRRLIYLNGGVAEAAHREEELKALLYLLVLALCDASRGLPKLSLRKNPRFHALSGALEQAQAAAACGEAVSVNELAAACGMGVSTLRRMFAASIGRSPREYLSALRMRRAQWLLYATPDAVTDVALALGYEDVSGFNRAFLAHCGMTPSEFRRRAQA